MNGSVVITASLSPTEKSTDLAGEPNLNVNNSFPDFTSHSFTLWSALPVINLDESPRFHKQNHRKTQLPIQLNLFIHSITYVSARKSGEKIDLWIKFETYWRHHKTTQHHCDHGRFQGVGHYRRTRQWECDPWRRRIADLHLCCTSGTSRDVRVPSSISASSSLDIRLLSQNLNLKTDT